MKIKFGTAIFGESNKAHSLLSSSDREFAKSLIPITDLPIELPNASGHSPMISGFLHEGRYVFLSSVRDIDASRGGMAKTTSLVTDIDNVGVISNLSRVFEQLDCKLPHFLDGRAVEIELEDDLTSSPSPGTLALVRVLIANRSPQPVIWVGSDGFQEALTGLWRGLPPAIKRSFTFRFCCTPRDGRTRGSSLIYTPIESRSRWKDHVCVQPPFDDVPASQIERLFTDEETRKSVLQWAEQLGAEPTSFEMFRLMADSQITYRALTSASDLDVTILSRSLSRLVPDPRMGKRIKSVVLQELQSRIIAGPLDTIAYLRNIVAAEYQDGFNIISRATASRFAKAIFDDENDALIYAQAAIEDGIRPWAVGVIEALTDALVKTVPVAVTIYWKLMTSVMEDTIQDWLVEVSQYAIDLEKAMLIHFSPSNLSESEGRIAAAFCRRTGWVTLHAHVVAFVTDAADALEEQLFFADESGIGIAELSQCLGPREFVRVAVNHQQSGRLLDQIIKECVSDITILTLFRVTNVAWRAAVCAIIVQSRSAIDQSSVLDDEVQLTWRLLTEGTLDDDQFLKALSRTKYANLLDVNGRGMLWTLLPEDLRTAFCKVTARAWLERSKLAGPRTERPEEVLCTELLRRENRFNLLAVAGPFAVITSLQVLDLFPELGASDFDEWRVRLLSTHHVLSVTDAKMIGTFVARRKWKTCANGLLDDYLQYSRRDLYPALCECAFLFSWLIRCRHWILKESPTVDQWWEEVGTLLVYLYPEGPRDKNVWERAGGDVSDLATHSTGREQWKKVLSELRKRASLGEATIESLVMECRSDYSTNADIVLLIDNCPFRLDISRYDSFLD